MCVTDKFWRKGLFLFSFLHMLSIVYRVLCGKRWWERPHCQIRDTSLWSPSVKPDVLSTSPMPWIFEHLTWTTSLVRLPRWSLWNWPLRFVAVVSATFELATLKERSWVASLSRLLDSFPRPLLRNELVSPPDAAWQRTVTKQDSHNIACFSGRLGALALLLPRHLFAPNESFGIVNFKDELRS